jgi:hypothetical protein
VADRISIARLGTEIYGPKGGEPAMGITIKVKEIEISVSVSAVVVLKLLFVLLASVA